MPRHQRSRSPFLLLAAIASLPCLACVTETAGPELQPGDAWGEVTLEGKANALEAPSPNATPSTPTPPTARPPDPSPPADETTEETGEPGPAELGIAEALALEQQRRVETEEERVRQLREALTQTAAGEPIETTVAEFVQAYDFSSNPLYGTDQATMIREISELPRIARMIDYAAQSPEQKAELWRLLQDQYDAYIHRMPDLAPQGEAWAPSVQFPGGLDVFPYVLCAAEFDPAASMEILLAAFHRNQQAWRSNELALANVAFVNNFTVSMIAYACDRFMLRLAGDADALARLAPDRREVIVGYAAFRPKIASPDATDETGSVDLILSSKDVMNYAERFVQ